MSQICFKKHEAIKRAKELTTYKSVRLGDRFYPMLVQKNAPNKRGEKLLIPAVKARILKSIRDGEAN